MARKKVPEAGAAKPPEKAEKVRTCGSLFKPVVCIIAFLIFAFYEWQTIGIMLSKDPFSDLAKGLLFALAMLLDALFVFLLGFAVLFHLVSMTAGSYPKGSLLLRIDSFVGDMLWWLLGGLWFARVMLQIVIASTYPISAFEY